MKLYRRIGSNLLKMNTKLLKKIGVFPIIDHYYEPLFNDLYSQFSPRKERLIPGINFNKDDQKKFLSNLNFQNDFENFLNHQLNINEVESFSLNNGFFESGDAEILFNFIRYIKPSRVIEIGCGSSTKIIAHALKLNEKDKKSAAEHICIEPYEQHWLEGFNNIKIIRDKIENIDLSIFTSLQDGDFLFIDSSHIIRPQGDVLKEYLEIVPSLVSGVYVHVHDIFTPYDYPEEWRSKNIRFWNEQYLLEATLSNNPSYKVVAALNFLKHEEYNFLKLICPYLTKESEPGSFYFKKV